MIIKNRMTVDDVIDTLHIKDERLVDKV